MHNKHSFQGHHNISNVSLITALLEEILHENDLQKGLNMEKHMWPVTI